ncbi:hypothetical protein LTR94_031539, partial [Friedmanniomyces endolithicus]
MHEFAEKLPVQIFMQIVDLPIEDLPKLKHLADQFTRPDGSLTYPEVAQLFRDYLMPVIAERRGGSGEDMISRMVNGQVGGRELTDVEAQNICMQVLVGGLDTVVNLLSFTLSWLAQDHDLLTNARWLGDIIFDTIPADGVGVYIDGQMTFSGLAPDASAFVAIVSMLNRVAASQVYTTDSLSS